MTDPTLAKICRQLSLVVITGVIIRRQAGPGLTLIILLSTTSSAHFIKLPSLNSFTEDVRLIKVFALNNLANPQEVHAPFYSQIKI